MNWREERKKELAEHVIVFYLCALIVIGIALMSTLEVKFNFYTIYHNATLLGIIFVAFALILLMHYYKDKLVATNANPKSNYIDLIFTFFIFISSIIIIFILGFKKSDFKVLFFIPVIYAAINHGRTIGLAFMLSSLPAVFCYHALFAAGTRVDADIALSLIMFMSAWLIGGFIDIERKTVEKLSELAHKDELTGLWNRRYFYSVVENIFFKVRKEKSTLSIIFADVDSFKTYNDNLGHLIGDEALKTIGSIFSQFSPPGSIPVRYGGEEFALLLPDYSSKQALDIAEIIRRQIEEHKFAGKECRPNEKLTISLGIAEYPEHANSLRSLLNKADEALFRVKSSRKNKAEIYRSVLDNFNNSEDIENKDLRRTLQTFLGIIQAKDRYTFGHSERVAKYAVATAEKLNLPETDIQALKLSAFYHDIGKIEIEQSLLNKSTPLTTEERSIIMKHPTWGAEIIGAVPQLKKCAPIIAHHHENYDGSGYPDGLKGKDIPLGARILRIVDSFDAMTTKRPYNKAMTAEESIKELKRFSGTAYDPDVVSAFIETHTNN